MTLFDYIYYSIAHLYGIQWGYYKDKEFTGIAFLSFIEFLHVVALFGFIKKPLFSLLAINPLIITFSGSLFFIALNSIRYKKFVTYLDLSKKWDAEPKRTILIKKIGVTLYIILTFVIAIYSESING